MPRVTTPDGRPAKARKREQEVLDAAARVFYKTGYAEATVQDVADELGILKGSLYYYIDTKEDLLFRLLEDLHEHVDAILERTRELQETGPLDRIAAYVRELTEFSLRDLNRVTVYYHDIDRLSHDRRRQIVVRRERHTEYIAELVAAAQAEGTLAPGDDPAVLTYCLFGTVVWTYRWYRPHGRFNIQEIADGAAEFVLSGLQHGALPRDATSP